MQETDVMLAGGMPQVYLCLGMPFIKKHPPRADSTIAVCWKSPIPAEDTNCFGTLLEFDTLRSLLYTGNLSNWHLC